MARGRGGGRGVRGAVTQPVGAEDAPGIDEARPVGREEAEAALDAPDPLGSGEATGAGGIGTLLRSTLLRSSAAYAGSNLLNRAVPFLLLPVLTRYLSPGDVGITAMYVAAVGLAAPLVGLSTDAAIGRRFFDRDQIDFPRYVATCLWLVAATGLVLTGLLALLAEPLAPLLAIPAGWVWTVAAVAAGRYLVAVALGMWQVRQRPGPYAVFSFVLTVLGLAISVYLVVARGWGWRGRVLGEITSQLLMGAIGLWMLFRAGWVRGGVDRGHLKDAVKYGGGLIPHVYGGLLIVTTDRLFLTHMVGVEETGLYIVGIQVAMLIGVAQQSFNQAWAPWLFGALKRNEPGTLRRVHRLTRMYNAGILAAAVALAALAPWLLSFLVGPEFRGASQFVLWLALASAFEGMYKMVVNQIFYAGHTHWLAWITFGTGVVNVGLNWLLISINGA
ncbi:MAG TPA: oligosaccharide flippase family protein, partial [Longimicrobium sp.]|nr:oligosaccharide flippase family protein [Longimicrobium sp.]